MTSIVQKAHQEAISAINQGRYDQAERLCNQIINHDESFADAWFLKAMSSAGKMDIRAALPSLIQALKLAPKNAEYLAQFAKLCAMVNQDQRALEAANRAIQQSPTNALTLDTIGVTYTKLGEYEKAQKVLTEAVKRGKNNPQFHFNLASAAQFIGNQKNAEKHYQIAIKLAPGFARAHWALSELNKNVTDADRIDLLASLLSKKGLSDDDELYLCHALSREKEKQGKYAEAFELLVKGKFRYRAKLNYSWVVDQRLFDAVQDAFPVIKKTDVDPSQGRDAIFVLGMPRSGTTLVERILSSHSEVESLGELQNFGLSVKYESNTSSRLILDKTVTQATKDMNFAKIGERYLTSLTNRKDSRRFIDKMPLNFLQLGYIAESLPAAKIILLKRNPMDTCLSNFRQLFAVSFSYYNYHYDLDDTGHYFRMFYELMAHWSKLYSDRIYTVNYESLTADPKNQVARLLDHCQLEWQEQCLAFHENKAASATASTMQVREPMYQSSVNRWKKYEDQLEPLKVIFEEAGIVY